MDPGMTLRLLRNSIINGDNEKNPFRAADYYEEAVRRFKDLDEWITKGGYLPDEWAPKS